MSVAMVMSESNHDPNKQALEKKVRILQRKLKRSEADRMELEHASDIRECVLKNVIRDLENSHTALKERGQALETALNDLKTLQMKLIESEKMSALGVMVAGIAHEINNPVSFIYGNLDYANEYLKDLLGLVQLYQKHYPEPITEIQNEIDSLDLEFLQADSISLFKSMTLGAERICEIVKSLRTFSRLDESACKVANLHEGIDSTLTILNSRLTPSAKNPDGIKLIRNYETNLPGIHCFPGPLNQVFMNVLVNSVDALDERIAQGKVSESFIPTIRITTKMTQKNRVSIRIADNGLGVPETIKDKLFDPFFTTKPVGKGTGLGLAISYQIVTESHKGQLWCDSTTGQGTIFTIELPITKGLARANSG